MVKLGNISLSLLVALLPLATAMVPSAPASSSGAPAASASGLGQPTNAVDPRFLTQVPTRSAAAAPSGTPTVRRVHPQGRADLCLSLQGGETAEGAEVGIAYCYPDNDKWAYRQKWDVTAAQRGEGPIKFDNGTFCLSIGENFSDAERPRLAKCLADSAQAKQKGQAWYVTRTTIRNKKENTNQCLDIRTSSPQYSGTGWDSLRDVQVWTCGDVDGNPQQVWTLMDSSGSIGAGSLPERRRSVLRGFLADIPWRA